MDAVAPEYIKYREYVNLLKHKIIGRDELVKCQEESIPIRNTIDDSFYPDDATLSLFAIIVYRKVLKTSFDDALKELKKKDESAEGRVREFIEKIPQQWKLYGWAENEKDGYFGAAFWNPKYRQLVISHKGTSSKKDMLADLEGVAQLKYTGQIHSACTFTALVLEGLDRSKIHISITGHSLGGWLGQITTFAMEYLTVNDSDKFTRRECRDPEGPIHCVVLDSPGCHETLRMIAGHYYPKYEKDVSTMISGLDITIYFNEPNLVNCCNSHRGISRLLQIYDPTHPMMSQILTEESSNSLISIKDKIENYIKMLKTHKGFNFLYLLTSSIDIEIKFVLNWPSFHLPEGVNKTRNKTAPSLRKAIPKVFEVLSPSFILWSEENELANHYQCIQVFDESRAEDGTQEQIAGIYNHYKVIPFDKFQRNASIFTEKEKEFLKYWQKVYDRKISVKKLTNIQKLLEKNQLGNFESFLPQFKIQVDGNKNEIIGCDSSQNYDDLEKIIRRVKQLNSTDRKAFECLKKDVYDDYIRVYESLSKRYLKKLPNYDVEFVDTIELEEFLGSDEKLLCLSTSRDTKDEVFRVRFILQELLEGSEVCCFGLAEFKELRNQLDVEKIYEDGSCSFDKILVIDCKTKKNEIQDKSFEDFIKMVKSSDSQKKVILIGDSGNKWLERILQENEIKKQCVAYSFVDFLEETRKTFLDKEVTTLWNNEIKMAQFLNSSDPKELTENEIKFLSQPDILNFLLEVNPDLNELSSLDVIDFDNMKIYTADLHKNIEQKSLCEFLEKSNELYDIFEKPIIFMMSGISKIELKELLNLEIITEEILHFLEDDSEEFFRLCQENMDKRIYWINFSEEDNEIKLEKIFDTDFYMKRTIYRKDEINKTELGKILKYEKQWDPCTFIFININRKKLKEVLNLENFDNLNWISSFRYCEGQQEETTSNLMKPFKINENIHISQTDSPKGQQGLTKKISVAVVDGIDEGLELYNQIIRETINPVHLINVKDDCTKFLWARSSDSIQTIHNILTTENTILTLKDFSALNNEMFLITGNSGTGKTTTLMTIAKQLINSWVIWINLINFRKRIDNLEGEINLENIIKFLSICNQSIKNPFVRDLLKFNLIHKKGIPIAIFFDGFDEINADVQEKILRILKFLKQKTNSTIYVTSKIWAKNIIEEELHVLPTIIKRIKRNQQKEFIKKFWLDVFSKNEEKIDYKEWLLNKTDELFEECQVINVEKTLTPSEESEVELTWDLFFKADQLISLFTINYDKLINILKKFYKLEKIYPSNSGYSKTSKFLEFIGREIFAGNEEIDVANRETFKTFLISAELIMSTIWRLIKKIFYSQIYLKNLYEKFQNEEPKRDLISKIIEILKIVEKYDPDILNKEEKDDILAIPLQLRMIGEILQRENDFEKAKKISKILLNNAFELYRQFTANKFRIYVQEKLQKEKLKSMTEVALLKRHQCLAFHAIFPNEYKTILENEEILNLKDPIWKEDVVFINKIGFLTVFNSGNISFTHISFAEYFAAEMIYQLMSKVNSKHENLENLAMSSVLLNKENEMIRRFLDGRLKVDLINGKNKKMFTCMEKAWVEARETSKRNIDISPVYDKVVNKMGETALHICASENLEYLAESIISCFKGESLQSYLDICNNNYETAFYYSAWKTHLDLATKFWEKGTKNNILQFNVNEIKATDFFNEETLLLFAVIIITYSRNKFKILQIENNGKLQMVYVTKALNIFHLLKIGENMDKLNYLSNSSLVTLLNLSIEYCSAEEIFTLMNRMPISQLNYTELLHQIIKKARSNDFNELCKKGADDGVQKPTPHESTGIQKVFWNLVLELIDRGADVKVPFVTRTNDTLLHYAASKGALDIVIRLLNEGVDMDVLETTDNLTPVNAAAKESHWDVVLELINRGANVKKPSLRHNRTVLFWAAYNGSKEVVLKSLDSEADINIIETLYNMTPMNAAAEKKHWEIVLELINRGGNVTIPFLDSKTTVLFQAALYGEKEVVLAALDAGAEIDAVETSDNMTPVNAAAQEGHWEIVLELINRGADVRKPSLRYKQTVLFYAAFKGSMEVVLSSIAANADIDAVEMMDNFTPVTAAALMGHWDIVLELINRGANVTVPLLKRNETVLLLAALKGKREIVLRALDAGADINAVERTANITPVNAAAQEGHWEIVLELVNRGADVMIPLKEKNITVLLWAAYKGSLEVVIRSLDAGADIDAAETFDNLTPVNAAAKEGHWEIVLELIRRGADVTTASFEYRQTVLCHAALKGKTEVVLRALDAGADINVIETSNNMTPVNAAAHEGHWEVVLELINRGANVNIPSLQYNQTVLFYAAFNGKFEVVLRALEAGAEIDVIETSDNLTPVNAAAEGEYWEIVLELINRGANVAIPSLKYNRTVLFWAAFKGSHEAVLRSLDAGANIDAIEIMDNYTAVNAAALGGHWDIVLELINRGADVTIPSLESKKTVLYWAAFKGSREVVLKSLDAGADINAIETIDNMTPVYAAALRDHWDIVLELIDRGADVRVQSLENKVTALYWAASRGEKDVVLKLLEAGADINATETLDNTTPVNAAAQESHWDVVMELIDKGADVRIPTLQYKLTTLHIAALDGKIDVVLKLIESGADINAVELSNNLTPINVAALEGHWGVVLELILKGANLDLPDKNNQNTVLHLAAEQGNLSIVIELLNHNAQIDPINIRKQTPMDVAAIGNHWDIVFELINSGADIQSADGDLKILELAEASGQLDALMTILVGKE